MGSQLEPAAAPIRLAILEADTPIPSVAAKYGSYGGVFTHLFTQACASLTPPQPLESQLAVTAYDIVNDPASYPAPESVDAVLITGSKHDSFANDEWIQKLVQYVKRVLEGGRVRVIGVCFGHQIIGRAMGAKVGRNVRGWELSVVELDLTEEGRRIFGGDKLRIHQMHRDQVFEYPAGTIPLASTAICSVQGMYIPKRMIAVQGHPEFNETVVRELLETRHESGIIPDAVYEDAMSRVANDQDGVPIARAFLRFLRE